MTAYARELLEHGPVGAGERKEDRAHELGSSFGLLLARFPAHGRNPRGHVARLEEQIEIRVEHRHVSGNRSSEELQLVIVDRFGALTFPLSAALLQDP